MLKKAKRERERERGGREGEREREKREREWERESHINSMDLNQVKLWYMLPKYYLTYLQPEMTIFNFFQTFEVLVWKESSYSS